MRRKELLSFDFYTTVTLSEFTSTLLNTVSPSVLPASTREGRLSGLPVTVQPCGCHEDGAVSQQCNETSGECRCRPGVTGKRCDRCVDGFHHLTSIGCLPCDCSGSGSTSPVCDKTTGQCPCKVHALDPVYYNYLVVGGVA